MNAAYTLSTYAAILSSRRKKQGRGKTRFPGLLRDASALGVHRNHLWLVLDGRRVSHRLIARYRERLAKEGRPIPARIPKA